VLDARYWEECYELRGASFEVNEECGLVPGCSFLGRMLRVTWCEVNLVASLRPTSVYDHIIMLSLIE
jgi:hypothetical protein